MFGETFYYKDIFGVSESSNIDASLFKFGSDKSVEWITSISISNFNDQTSFLDEFNNTLYTSFFSDRGYLWLASFETINGLIQNSNWIFDGNVLESNGTGRFSAILVSEKWIFAKDSRKDTYSNMPLLIFETSTFQLK